MPDTAIDHSARAHALLSASASKRWIACPPSVRLTEDMPDSSSPFADEGTRAHELCELYLRQYLGKIPESQLKEELAKHDAPPEMLRYAQEYADYVLEVFYKSLKQDGLTTADIEVGVDYSNFVDVPGSFGTCDCIIIGDHAMHVIDFKYGKGVPVDAKGNPQLRLYALGAMNRYEMLYDIKEVTMTIYQPRLDSVTTETMSVEDLYTWAEQIVRPAAQLAFAGKGEFKPGEHCRFCKAKATCKARAEENLALVAYKFMDADLLSDDEIVDVLGRVDELVRWSKDVKEFALTQAVAHGKKWPGMKLVAGKGSRAYTNEAEVKDTLEMLYDEDQYAPRQLLSVAQLEKALGKKAFASLKGFVESRPGKPTLVPESDKRPELTGEALAGAKFEPIEEGDDE